MRRPKGGPPNEELDTGHIRALNQPMDKLGIPIYRRAAGVFFGFAFYFLGFLLVAFPQIFPRGVSGFDAADVGMFLVITAIITTPAILYPCLFDLFPKWLHINFPQIELYLRQMLCPEKKT